MNKNQTNLINRFLKYSSIPSQSKEGVAEVPSTPGQLVLAKELKKELEEMGLDSINLSSYGVLTARLKGNGDYPKIGWI